MHILRSLTSYVISRLGGCKNYFRLLFGCLFSPIYFFAIIPKMVRFDIVEIKKRGDGYLISNYLFRKDRERDGKVYLKCLETPEDKRIQFKVNIQGKRAHVRAHAH